MFNLMLSFDLALLNAVADWLGSEPMIYVFGLVVFAFVAKFVATLLR